MGSSMSCCILASYYDEGLELQWVKVEVEFSPAILGEERCSMISEPLL